MQQVVDWLIYDAVPKDPSDVLCGFAKYWHMTGLEAAIREQTCDYCLSIKDDNRGFVGRFYFRDLPRTFAQARPRNINFSYDNRQFFLTTNPRGVFLNLIQGETIKIFTNYTFAGQDGARDTVLDATTPDTFEEGVGWGYAWSRVGRADPFAWQNRRGVLVISLDASVAEES